MKAKTYKLDAEVIWGKTNALSVPLVPDHRWPITYWWTFDV